MPGSEHVHSLEQIAFIQKLSQRLVLEPREAMYLASQLVNHGFPGSHDFLSRLEADIRSRPGQDYIARLKKRNGVIQALPQLRRFREDPGLVRQLYEGEGYLFRPGSHRRSTAVVVFTTKFNNFTLSNLVVDALLAELGVSRLFLRDGTDFAYFKGVKGLADSLDDLPLELARLLRDEGIDDVILAGYSSGGYAALHVASMMANVRCVAFSAFTDLSAGSALPRRDLYERARAKVDPALYKDLAKVLVPDRGVTYCVHYGKRNADDRIHAEHLVGLPGVEVVGHESYGHEVPAHLLEEERLAECFARHIRTDRAA